MIRGGYGIERHTVFRQSFDSLIGTLSEYLGGSGCGRENANFVGEMCVHRGLQITSFVWIFSNADAAVWGRREPTDLSLGMVVRNRTKVYWPWREPGRDL